MIDTNKGFKLFGRYWHIGISWIKGGQHWLSFYTFKATPPDFDDWYSFLALTYTNDPTTNPWGKKGWHIER